MSIRAFIPELSNLEISQLSATAALKPTGRFNCGKLWKILRMGFKFWYVTRELEEVVQVYGICIRTLHLPVISVMIIGVMRLSYNERAVSEGRSRGPPRRVSAYEISKSTGFQVDFRFQNGFLDFKVDFGFQNGFLDFKVDFWISKWISRGISGFQANFWISKRISGFQSGFLEEFLDLKRISGFQSGFLDFIWTAITEDTAKIYSWFINCIPLSLYANRIQSQVLHRYIAHRQRVRCHTYTLTVIHKYSACSLLIHNVVSSPDSTLLAGRCVWAGHEHT